MILFSHVRRSTLCEKECVTFVLQSCLSFPLAFDFVDVLNCKGGVQILGGKSKETDCTVNSLC